MKRPPLRSHDEIQFAHDLLTGLLLGDPDTLHRIVDTDKVEQLVTATDVLCWVLNHKNPRFEVNLKDVEHFLKEEGVEMREMPGEN